MALVTFNFESKYLRKNEDVTIILPDKPRGARPEDFYTNGKKYKVLWLLHGTFGDHTDWIRHTRIELYACEKDCIVVMPSAINTNYENWPYFGCGYYMEDFLVKELMPIVHNWFPASSKKEDNFISGLSMGGKGALFLALRHPDLFGACSDLSSFPVDEEMNRDFYESVMKMDPKKLAADSANYSSPFDANFKLQRTYSNIMNAGSVDAFIKNSSWYLLPEFAKREDCPRLYFACGTNDTVYPRYVALKEYAKKIGLKATFEEEPGMKHEWRFWDKYIEKSFDFFGLPGEFGGKEIGGNYGA